MSELKGYTGRSLEFLEKNNIIVGDSLKIISDMIFEGILMPRYEHADDAHLVLKLKSGYNVGIKINEIKKIEKISSSEKKPGQEKKIELKPYLPKILLLSTGGTIASKIDYRTGAVTPILTPSELNSSIPELSEIANIDSELLFSEYSENLQPEHWEKICQSLDSYANSDYKGIIIAHGTDTMQYTASFLSFALAGYPKPVALVGSQRSSDRPSSDAALNLIGAARFLVGENENGIFVIMHENESDDLIACHIGTRVRKNHTSKRGAFKTIGGKPAFLISDNKIEKNLVRKMFVTDNYDPKISLDPNVALIKYHPGLNPRLIESAIESGHKGIIFEGTGLGHVGRTMYDAIKKASENGLFLGMTSQCIEGRVCMTVYESGRDLMNLGIIPLKDMIPETALVKAMWAIGNSQNNKEVEEKMLENVASEFSD